jgi:2-keto-4-pentenoate hydratase/2-oxohepta-3-ene-1,7-dioic acid hydratase in catechol pathway
MKYLTFAIPDDISHPCLGALIGETVVDLVELRTWAQGARAIPTESLPESLLGLIYAGSSAWDYTRKLVSALNGEDAQRLKGAHRKPVGYALNQVVLYPPLPNPESLRDFYAFEDHVKNTFSIYNKKVPAEWYQFPVFYFSNPHTIFGQDSIIPYPPQSFSLDYELEVAGIISKPGMDITVDQAGDYIFGYTIFNDWSARDIQRLEMRVGLGPAKGKDFASSLGPWIVTPDELADKATDRPGVYDLTMIARVNGEERSRGNWQDIHYSFGEMIARASENTYLLPGEVLGSGTVGDGCLLEITKGEGPWLNPGDIVELEIERLGILVNQVGTVTSRT